MIDCDNRHKIIMFARRWRRQHSISDLLKEPVAQEAIQVQFCFLEHCDRSCKYLLSSSSTWWSSQSQTLSNILIKVHLFFKAVPPQELWQGLLKEGDHWRDIYDDMHKANHFHNHCHHDPHRRHHQEIKGNQNRMKRKQISGATAWDPPGPQRGWRERTHSKVLYFK